jgi:SecD/SecF fusion protein
MISAGRKQFLGVAVFVVAMAAVGAFLTYRQACFSKQGDQKVVLLVAEQDLQKSEKISKDLALNLTASEVDKKAAAASLTKAQEQVEVAKDSVKDSAPQYGWAGWVLALFVLLSFLSACSLAGQHVRRFVIIGAVTLGAAALTYFGDRTYGIDLRGGAELRYRMVTDEVDVKIKEMKKLLVALEAGGLEAAASTKTIKTKITGLETTLKDARDEDTRKIVQELISDLKRQLDPKTLKSVIAELVSRRRQSVDMAVDVIRKRIDSAGIKQVTVRLLGQGQLLLQIPIKLVVVEPGKSDEFRLKRQMEQLRSDVSEMKNLVGQPGILEFRWVYAVRGGYAVDQEIANKIWAGEDIPGFEIKKYESQDNVSGKSSSEELILRTTPVLTGAKLERAHVGMGQQGREIRIRLSAGGGNIMSEATSPSKIVFKRDRLAVVMDGKVKTAPTVQTKLGRDFQITGNFTSEEADRLTQILNAGSLDFRPALVSENHVGPGLGQDAVDAGTRASLLGAGLVLVFMAAYYLGAGLVANISLGMNILLILGAMSLLGGTFTLPGIAGIALTLGMAVDANVLIFERIREEKLRGKPINLAIKTGHERALVTILDANITTFITALILYRFGTGAVKGFAVTLSLGIIASLFTSLFVTRSVLEFLVDRGLVKELKMLRIVGETKIAFMKLRPAMFMVSALLLGGAIALMVVTKNRFGLDFTGGLEVQVRLKDRTSAEDVRQKSEKVRVAMQQAADEQAAKSGQTPVKIAPFAVQAYSPGEDGQSRDFKISCQLTGKELALLEKSASKSTEVPDLKSTVESGAPLAAVGQVGARDDVLDFFRSSFAGLLHESEPFPGKHQIGGKVAGEMMTMGFFALVLSVVFIFFYILVRFDFIVGFGLGAAAALVHDAVIAVGVLFLANNMGMVGARVDLVIIAALLTIIGYSLNDTIVVFDRIRENRVARKSMSMRELIDLSVNQTLGRTVLTSLTTLLAVLSILFLGGASLQPFALVFAAGVVIGTYSSVFVASAVALSWENWREKRREVARKQLHA